MLKSAYEGLNARPKVLLHYFCTFQFLHFFTFALLHLAYIFSKWINWKSIFPKCIFPKCIFPECIFPKCISAKCTRLACLLSFASLFSYGGVPLCRILGMHLQIWYIWFTHSVNQSNEQGQSNQFKNLRNQFKSI